MITIMTDFGESFYVAEMKGVIYRINKDCKIVDVVHNIISQNVIEGAFILSRIWKYFPKGTVHIGVIDPGVGGSRKGIVIETDYCYFVGPDNGLFSLAIKNQNVKGLFEIDESRISELSSLEVSKTFHGRDVFAPAAALISKGVEIASFCSPLDKIVELGLQKGIVIYIDKFGDVITSISDDFNPGDELTIGYKDGWLPAKFVETFGDAHGGELIVLKGSHGFLEIDINKGDASKELNARVGDQIRISKR